MDGSYATGSGTSFSSPTVAGLATLLLSVDSTLTPAQVKQYIVNGATDLGASGWDVETGYGLVNFKKSIELLLGDLEAATVGHVKGKILTKNYQNQYVEKISVISSGDLVETVYSNLDGTFNIELDPGTYDIVIDKAGYLEVVVNGIIVEAGKTKTIEELALIPGDVNKDGAINMTDLNLIVSNYFATSGGLKYSINMDFNDDGVIDMTDLNALVTNYLRYKMVITYEND